MDGTRRLLALAVVTALAAACDASEPTPPASPTSVFATTTPTTGPSGPVVTGQVPDPGDVAAGTLTEGTLRLRVVGGVALSAELSRLLSGVASPPPGGFAVVWSGDVDATTVGIGGGAFVGTRPTSPTLVLSVTAQTTEGLSTWVSAGGECAVTLEDATRARFVGSFSCEDFASTTGEVADVSGVFEATG